MSKNPPRTIDLPFDELGLPEKVLDSIRKLGFERPTPIQAKGIPEALAGHDLIGKAETGTGKTLAFLAPILSQIEFDRVSVQALVLCPTRELAQQVEASAVALGRPFGLRTALVVGGVHASSQLFSLHQGAHLVVGTPGRVLEFLEGRSMNFGWVRFLVLDEADRMCDMGFIEEVSTIIAKMPVQRQTLLFSATITPDLKRLTSRFMKDPKSISTATGKATVRKISQYYLEVRRFDREQFIVDLLADHPDDTCIIFCNTKRGVRELDRTLWGLGLPAGAIHGDQEQETRFQVLEAFRDRSISVLVATDVAARGLDIEAVSRVVNYDVPEEVETYIHRIGRTGRAGESGESITLVTDPADRSWTTIKSTSNFDLKELTWERKRAKPRPGENARFSSRSRSGPRRRRSS